MKVYLRVREGRPAVAEFAHKLTTALESNEYRTIAEPADAELIIAVGGDGTMLSAAEAAFDADVPVLGFNLGTLGFLAAAEQSDLEDVVARLRVGDFEIEDRMTVAATVHGETTHGVNDVVIEKVDNQRLVELDVEIGSSEFSTYRADGLIVATPTGSTAYSFSAGGPLVDPAVDAFVLTPVAAHSLFARSIVLSPDKEIVVTVRRDRDVKLSVDKQNLGHLSGGDKVSIRRGDRPVKFVKLDASSFAGLVRRKFNLP